MSPFSQSVAYSSASPAMFPSPPGIIEAAFVNLSVLVSVIGVERP